LFIFQVETVFKKENEKPGDKKKIPEKPASKGANEPQKETTFTKPADSSKAEKKIAAKPASKDAKDNEFTRPEKTVPKKDTTAKPAPAIKPSAPDTTQKPTAPEAEKKAPEAKPARKAAALINSAKFIPVEVDDVWADTQSAYEKNNEGLDVPQLTRSVANSQFSGIIEYARANSWISDEQKDNLMKGNLPENFVNELALLKAMLRVSTQRGGMGHVKESFDAYTGKGVNEVLLALPEIAKNMPAYDKGGNAIKEKTIGAHSVKFWAREFGAILAKGKVDMDALKTGIEAAKNKAFDAPKEVAGELHEYTDVEIFKQDWRVAASATAIGSTVDYEKFKNAADEYDVGMALAAAKAAVDATERMADPARNAACDGIAEIAGTVKQLQNGNMELSGGITREGALALAVEAKVLYSGSSRDEVKKAAKRNKDNVSGEVFKAGDRFYALSNFYAKANAEYVTGTPRAEGRKIANAPLDNPLVKEMLRQRIHGSLVAMGVADESGNRLVDFGTEATNSAVSDYLGKKAGLTQDVRLQLAGIALASRQDAVAKRMGTAEALIAEEPEVVAAIAAKCAPEQDKNAAALALARYLNDNADSLGLKDDAGNFTKKKEILDAIRQYEVNASEKTGPITAPIVKKKEQEPTPVKEMPARETPGQAPVVAITQEAYDRMGLVEKKREIGKFANGANDAETAKARDAIFGAGNMDNGKIEPRLKYLASLPSERIFEDDGSKMSAKKLVAALEKYEKDEAAKQGAATEFEEVKASRPQMYGLLVNKYDDLVKAVKANNTDVIGTEQKAKDAIAIYVKEKAYDDNLSGDTDDAAVWANRIVPYYHAASLRQQ
jgi:hypothetical protein